MYPCHDVFFLLLDNEPVATLTQKGNTIVASIHIVGRLAIDSFGTIWLQCDGLGIADGVVRFKSQNHAIFCRGQIDGVCSIGTRICDEIEMVAQR